MSINLISSPNKLINGIQSNVNAGRSQLPYTFQREDYQIKNLVAASGDPLKLGIVLADAEGDVKTSFNVGDVIYYDGGDTGEYTGLHTVVVSNFTGTNTKLDTATTYGILETGGFINNLTARRNYKVDIFISDPAGVHLIPTSFLYSPAPDGSLFIDISQIITELQEEVLGTSLEYSIRYREIWEGSPSPAYGGAPVIQSIYAERQIFQLGGSNLWQYLLSTGLDQAPFKITDFYPAVAGDWFEFGFPPDGYPDGWRINDVLQGETSSQLILNRAISGSDFDVTITYTLTLSGNTSGVTPVCFTGAESGCFGLRDVPNTSGSIGTFTFSYTGATVNPNTAVGFDVRPIDGNVDFFVILDVKITPTKGKLLTVFENPIVWNGWIRTIGVIVDANYLARNGVTSFRVDARTANINKDEGIILGSLINESVNVSGNTIHQLKIPLGSDYYTRIRASLDGVQLTSETLYYKTADECESPLMVHWINSLGGAEQHLFSVSQEVERTVEEGLLAERVINQDYEITNRTKIRNPNIWKQNIILRADGLLKDQMLALLEIKQSDYVTVFLNKAGTKEIFVVVSNGYSNMYDTKNKLFEFTLQLEMPDNYDIFKVLEY